VVACDIDHSAAVVAHGNLPELPLFTGSLRSVRDRSFDIVVANLNAATLDVLGRDIVRVTRSGAVVSGFREQEQDDVARSLGRTPYLKLELDGWACLVFTLEEI
jgi:ribosomal protein L11 methylase PrmA